MSRFYECLPFILQREGGYVDNHADYGGATNQGITDATYQRWLALNGHPAQPVKFMTNAERDDVYLTMFWDAARCDNLLSPLDMVMFDAWVQHRPTVAAKFLQQAVGVVDDGIIGPATLNAARSADALSVSKSIIALREQFYRRIVEKDASQSHFFIGWLNRLSALRTQIGG